MHQDLLQLQAYQNPSMTKNASPKIAMILKSPWLMPWGTLTKIAHFSEILLSHDPLFGQKWPKQLRTKSQPFQKILTWGKVLQFGRSPMTCVVARNKQDHENEKKKKWTKKENDCHIMHLENLISLNKSQESQVQKKMLKKLW